VFKLEKRKSWVTFNILSSIILLLMVHIDNLNYAGGYGEAKPAGVDVGVLHQCPEQCGALSALGEHAVALQVALYDRGEGRSGGN
jgi:hypothetical protein